jgi:hypothetical protein
VGVFLRFLATKKPLQVGGFCLFRVCVMRGCVAYLAQEPVRDAAFLAASAVNSSNVTKCAISNLSTMADTDRLSIVAACFASSETSGDTRIPMFVDLFTENNLQCSRLVVDRCILQW